MRIVFAVVLATLAFAGPAAAQDNRPPTAPGNLRVVDVDAFSAELRWNASTDDRDGADRLSYIVFGPPDGTFGDQWGWAHGQTGTTVDRLRPGTSYTFTVRAMDSWAQLSPQTNSVTITTDAIDPLPVPTNVRTTRNVTGTELELAFDAAEDPRVALYHIWRDGEQFGFAWPGQRTFTATGLEPQTEYDFTVTSAMVGGIDYFDGAHSAPARITTAPDGVAPGRPSFLAVDDRTGTSVFLRWGPATDNVGVTEFVVSDGSITRTVPVGRDASWNQTQLEFTGLSPETSYTFTVRARDAAGNLSAPSAPRTIATGVHPDTEPPAPVTGLQGMAEPDFFVFVSWAPSTDNVTLPGGLRYRLHFEDGPSIVLNHTTFSAERDMPGPQLFGCFPTVRAIDRAGNESAPRSVNIC
jgi:chitodextrinase